MNWSYATFTERLALSKMSILPVLIDNVNMAITEIPTVLVFKNEI